MNAQMPIAVKICGITQIKQALEIASIGADVIGVIGVKKSPRFLPSIERRKLFDELVKKKPTTERAWVIADLDIKEIIQELSKDGSPSIVQLHGNESIEKCNKLKALYPNIQWCKAFRIRHPNDLTKAQTFQKSVDSILLDSWSNNALGGTGSRIPIEWLDQISFKIPWWLAGGISVNCISEILSKVQPSGIDASSKLEISPGIKEIKEVRCLIEKVKGK